MGIQIVVKINGVEAVESAFGADAAHLEVFPLGNGHIGISIPKKVIDALGEDAVNNKFSTLEHYDLWSGRWRNPKPKWKFW